MKTKLLGVVAGSVLALNVGTASADTFNVNGTFPFSTVITSTFGCSGGPPSCPGLVSQPDRGASLSGTVTIANGVLTSVNLSTRPFEPAFVTTLGFYFPLDFVWNMGVFSPVTATLSNLSPDGQSWSLSLVLSGFGGTRGGSLSFFDTNGILSDGAAQNCCGPVGGSGSRSLQQWAQPGAQPPGIDAWTANYSGLFGAVTVVPLPSALPLFATGLGALGLLGWRRKRKAAVVA